MGIFADVLKAGVNTKGQRDELTRLLMQRGALAMEDIEKIKASMSPIYWSDISKTVHAIPLGEITRTVEPAEKLLPEKIIRPEDFKIGSRIIPAVGDRTDAGNWLTDINGKQLARRVRVDGGNGFMRSAAQIMDNAAWASSTNNAATRILNKARREMDASGEPVHMMFAGMGPRSGDFSVMMTDTLLAQIEGGGISRKALQAFESDMGGGGWPGLSDPALRDMLSKSGPMRKRMVEMMAKAKHQEAGFPDIASTRVAISDPSMFLMPTGMSGHSISKLDESTKLLDNPTVPHGTYPHQITGTYSGRLDHLQPAQMIWRDFHKARRKAGKEMKGDGRALMMSTPSQRVDQQWVDTMMRWRPK